MKLATSVLIGIIFIFSHAQASYSDQILITHYISEGINKVKTHPEILKKLGMGLKNPKDKARLEESIEQLQISTRFPKHTVFLSQLRFLNPDGSIQFTVQGNSKKTNSLLLNGFIEINYDPNDIWNSLTNTQTKKTSLYELFLSTAYAQNSGSSSDTVTVKQDALFIALFYQATGILGDKSDILSDEYFHKNDFFSRTTQIFIKEDPSRIKCLKSNPSPPNDAAGAESTLKNHGLTVRLENGVYTLRNIKEPKISYQILPKINNNNAANVFPACRNNIVARIKKVDDNKPLDKLINHNERSIQAAIQDENCTGIVLETKKCENGQCENSSPISFDELSKLFNSKMNETESKALLYTELLNLNEVAHCCNDSKCSNKNKDKWKTEKKDPPPAQSNR